MKLETKHLKNGSVALKFRDINLIDGKLQVDHELGTRNICVEILGIGSVSFDILSEMTISIPLTKLTPGKWYKLIVSRSN